MLHLTEALAAGVGLSVARLAALQAQAGIRPTVVGLRRYDTPDDDELRTWFGPGVDLVVYPRAGAGRFVQLTWLAWRLIRLLATRRYEVLHLHSSFAGAVGRPLGAFFRHVRVFYSPHGFAFLRSDLPGYQQKAILWAERLLALFPSRLVLVSESEMATARRVSARTALLENGVDLARIEVQPPRVEPRRPRVVMIGRVAEQKAPWRFAAAASRYSHRAEFVWLGYGPATDVERWLGSAPVTVTGRLEHKAMLTAMQAADIVYFPTLWEGMPLSLIEAQACGLPAVASDVGGNRDVVIDGVTGLLRATESSLEQALGVLIDDSATRRQMAAAAAEHAHRFSDAERAERSFDVYGITVER